MNEARNDTSLRQHVIPLALGAEAISAGFLGRTPAFALADGAVMLAGDEEARIVAHEDAAVLVAASDGQRFITGGDDGRLVATRADGSKDIIADEKGRWIDALALRADGAVAWSAGKSVKAQDARGGVKEWTAPSTVRGLAFLAKGYRLAAAHYNGVSLWFPNIVGKPEFFEWKGSHLDVTVSPDGRFVVSSMQENALHGWTLDGKKNMRMTGYPAKTRSFSWSRDGQWLATSGADACIVWPFKDKTGPMGKPPRECGARPARVTRVAFHPGSLVVAIGYEDGWLLLCRLTDASELPVAVPVEGEGAAITALAWDSEGKRLLFADRAGKGGLLTLPG